MSNQTVNNNANSGWIYQIGDNIFGDVLLISANGLYESFLIYSANVTSISDLKLIDELDLYDCIILNSIEDASKISNHVLLPLLKKNGVISRILINETGILSIRKLKYPINVFKYLYSQLFANNNKNIIRTCYMYSADDQIEEVFYSLGYMPIKNIFLFKEKVKKIIFNKTLFPFFLPLKLQVTSPSGSLGCTVVDTVVNEISNALSCKKLLIEKIRVIPFKVLVTVKQDAENSFIILMLRGREKNIRANAELDMLDHLNNKYTSLQSLLSLSVLAGNYKNIEYIVYKELHGVHIDRYFNQFYKAERSAFNMLLYLGDESRKVTHLSKELYTCLVYPWIEYLSNCKVNTGELSSCLDVIFDDLWKVLSGKGLSFVLFHGDYKIENLLFDPSTYEVSGIIDWDLAVESHVTGMDLLYFIFYNRRIKRETSFIVECDAVFFRDGFSEKEIHMIKEYVEHFSITEEVFNAVIILFLLHHFSCREQYSFSEKWLTSLLDTIRNSKIIINFGPL